MSDGDMARASVGPASHRDPEAWCSERGHYRPERPRPGVPDGDTTGPNGQGLVFPDGDITGPNGQGLVFPDGGITGPNGRGLVFQDGDNTGLNCRGLVFSDGDITGLNCRGLVSGALQAQIPSTASDGLAPSAFDPSLEYSTDNVVLFWRPRPIFRIGRLRRLSSTACHILARSSL